MNSRSRSGGFWPTRDQELLLQAALLDGTPSVEAWQQWQANVDLDELDPASRRLLPLLYHNLHRQGIEDSQLGKFKGIHRLTWYENQTVFYTMTGVLRALHAAGIQTLVLKGAALTVLHYPDHGLRRMNDFDVLVPAEDVLPAIEILHARGWRPQHRSIESLTNVFLASRHAQTFEDNAGHHFDLHWHVLETCLAPDADDDFWAGAIPLTIHDVSTLTLNPTDQLLHVCAHGAKWTPIPPFRWVADAVAILNTSQAEIDWDRLIAQAEKRQLILALRETLAYLQETVEAPIPPAVLERMQAIPVTEAERRDYARRHRPVDTLDPFRILWRLYLRYRHAPNQVRSHGFPRYLQHLWAIDHLWQLPLHAFSKAVQRLWRIASRRTDQLRRT